MKKQFAVALATAVILTSAVPAAFAQSGAPVATPAVATVDAKTAADAFLKQNAGKYELKADLSDLQYVTTVRTDAADYVRYQQTYGGKEVFYNQVTVTLDKAGNAVLVTSDYAPNLTAETTKKNITENEAEGLALGHTKIKNLASAASRKFGYIVQDKKLVPAYKVTTVSAIAEEGEFETYVHAGTGAIIKSRDLRQKVNGTGKVFLPNPVVSSGNVNLTDNNNADYDLLTNELKTVTLQGLDGSGYLTGQYVSISNKKSKTFSSSFVYNYTRSSAHFENTNVYYHLDSLQRYIQSIGFNNINNRSIVANVNGTTADNSYYSPSTKALTFGTGGVDDAEDAGVIVHEYGHSIQDNQVPGFGNSAEGGAMGEAFGDFLGATYESFLKPDPKFDPVVAEWDAVSYSSDNPPNLRRLDEGKVYPQDWQGEVHADGEIWSQGEYEMAKAFGRDIATRIILQSHWSLTPNATFNDGARAIKAADQLLYGGSHAAQIDAIWAARGISTN
ncbi:M36 family metallopeptidase [Tumebacillus sp. DT12]|uniref:M36 family metallopeptidase n=1 Tax=Tumebacillus lacus TaxID=2995335 RepID=A0ABT3X040_9BACL|nr:M36 family metallopeptidase [Tumebacillus lacus]MCX7568915.1 M36 family metallopeptidase [Tumebacillus lacus]